MLSANGGRDGLEYTVQLSDDFTVVSGEGTTSACKTWVSSHGVAVTCDLNAVPPGEDLILEAFLGTLIHEYGRREAATVRNVARLSVSGANAALGYQLIADCEGVYEHRIVAGALPKGAPRLVAVLQVSWKSVCDETTDTEQGMVAGILRSWRLGTSGDADQIRSLDGDR